MYTLNPDLERATHDSLHSEDEMQTIVSSTTGRRAPPQEISDKQMDELMYLVYGEAQDEEDSYEYL